MAFVTPTDVATGEVLTASRYNQDVVENTIASPRGVLKYVQNTTLNQTASTSGTDITGLTTGSVTVPAGRVLRVSVYLPSFDRNGGMSVAVRIVEDSTNVQYGRIDRADQIVPMYVSAVRTGVTAGAHTWKAQVVIIGGAGTWAAVANTTTGAAYIMLEDLGAE
jgi:hypothetical protein